MREVTGGKTTTRVSKKHANAPTLFKMLQNPRTTEQRLGHERILRIREKKVDASHSTAYACIFHLSAETSIQKFNISQLKVPCDLWRKKEITYSRRFKVARRKSVLRTPSKSIGSPQRSGARYEEKGPYGNARVFTG